MGDWERPIEVLSSSDFEELRRLQFDCSGSGWTDKFIYCEMRHRRGAATSCRWRFRLVMSINSVSISGNLTRDCEVRLTQTGTTVVDFTVAVSERVNQGGEWTDRPNYIDCTLFDKTGNRANALGPKLTKGVKVSLSGRLRSETWEKDGQRRSKLEVVVDDCDAHGGGFFEVAADDFCSWGERRDG